MIVQRFHKFMYIIVRHIHAEALAFQSLVCLPVKNTVNDHIAQLLRVVAGFIIIIPVFRNFVYPAEVVIPSAGGPGKPEQKALIPVKL